MEVPGRAGNTSSLLAAGCICPQRAEDTCLQHKSPPRCRNAVCNILQGFDAFHVQLQEQEDAPAAALQRNTQMLWGRGERRRKGQSCTMPWVKAVRDA